MHVTQALEPIVPGPYIHNDIQHPASIFTIWTRAQKRAIGIYEVVSDPVPDGKVATAWTLEMAGGYVKRIPTLEDYVEPVPTSVSRAQGKLALVGAGLWQGIVDYVALIDDPMDRAIAQAALYDTQEWRRSSPFLATAAAALGLTQEQLDGLFRAAAQIKI